MPKTRTSARQQLAQGAKLVELGHALNNTDFIEEGSAVIDAASRVMRTVEQQLEEHGTVGEFAASTPALAVQARRKRSAVVVGEETQLPLVAGGNLVCPNIVLRSALFGLRARGRTAGAVLRSPIASSGDTQILFTGLKLGQRDLSVWLHCLDLARECLEKTVVISMYALNQRLGMADSSSNKELLLDSLGRLGGATVTIRSPTDEIMIENRLLTYKHSIEHGVHMLRIKVDPDWARLFGVARWTRIAVDVRAKLNGKELAQWLSSVLLSHSGKVKLHVEELHRLSGSAATLREFRRMLSQALVECAGVGLDTENRINWGR